MFSAFVSHTHIGQGEINDNRMWLNVASFGLAYQYNFNEKWSLGVHADILIEDFTVERKLGSEDEAVITRSYPVALVARVNFKPIHFLSLSVGLGPEFEPEETLTILQIGLEYVWEVDEKFEVLPVVAYDIRFNAFDSWTLGLGVGYKF
jgi:opacity protein-like surface antigen